MHSLEEEFDVVLLFVDKETSEHVEKPPRTDIKSIEPLAIFGSFVARTRAEMKV